MGVKLKVKKCKCGRTIRNTKSSKCSYCLKNLRKEKNLKKTIKKQGKPTFLKKQCDELFSKLVRERDGKCLKCGSTKNLQCSHLINITNLAHRWDLNSAFTLCYRCHLCWWHKEPLEANMWLAENLPDMNVYYWEHKEDVAEIPVDYEKVLKGLKDKLGKFHHNMI